MRQDPNPLDETTIQITDIPGEASYLAYNNIPLDYRREDTGYVVAYAPRTAEVTNLIREFHGNPEIKVLDFLAVQRRERGKMLDLRNRRGL